MDAFCWYGHSDNRSSWELQLSTYTTKEGQNAPIHKRRRVATIELRRNCQNTEKKASRHNTEPHTKCNTKEGESPRYYTDMNERRVAKILQPMFTKCYLYMLFMLVTLCTTMKLTKQKKQIPMCSTINTNVLQPNKKYNKEIQVFYLTA